MIRALLLTNQILTILHRTVTDAGSESQRLLGSETEREPWNTTASLPCERTHCHLSWGLLGAQTETSGTTCQFARNRERRGTGRTKGAVGNTQDEGVCTAQVARAPQKEGSRERQTRRILRLRSTKAERLSHDARACSCGWQTEY